MKKFYIDIAYVTSVSVYTEYKITKQPEETSEDFLVRTLKSSVAWTSVGTKDHDEFTKLRNQLEDEGYIRTVRNYWNGDYVLKKFYLNDICFRKSDQFLCAAAMKYKLEKK